MSERSGYEDLHRQAMNIAGADSVLTEMVAQMRWSGHPVVQAFAFDWDDGAELAAGLPLLDPGVGDLLLDVWTIMDVGFNGDAAYFDVGQFVDGQPGWFAQAGGPISAADTSGVGRLSFQTPLLPARFSTTDSVKLCVSTTGGTDGDETGSTAGGGTIYLSTVIPLGDSGYTVS